MAGAAGTKARGQIGLSILFPRAVAPFTVAGLGKLIERAGIASAAIELHRRQLSPARCGRLLAPTNTSLGHTLTPMHRCTWHWPAKAFPSAVGVAGAFSCWPQTNTPLRSCRPSAHAGQAGGWSGVK